MLIRSTCSAIVALGLTFAMVPLGCGGAPEQHALARQPKSETKTNTWTAPASVIEQAQSCVTTHVRDLKTYAHDAEFEATVDEDGAIQSIKMRRSTLNHEQLESCLMQALTALPIPPSAISMRASGPVSGGESTRDSRKPLGIVQALGGAIAFGPIFVVAAGVTLGVYIVAVAAEQAIEVAKRNRKINKMCIERRQECLDTRPGICGECYRFCLLQGRWNELACPRYRPN